ncbi:MAG: hypothetical protein ABEJ66_03485 [Candidatus Nanohaloarchaea archaeon]
MNDFLFKAGALAIGVVLLAIAIGTSIEVIRNAFTEAGKMSANAALDDFAEDINAVCGAGLESREGTLELGEEREIRVSGTKLKLVNTGENKVVASRQLECPATGDSDIKISSGYYRVQSVKKENREPRYYFRIQR